MIICQNCGTTNNEALSHTCRKCGAIFHVKNVPPKVSDVCDNCGGELYQREDEKPEAIKIRMIKYHEKTKPLIDYYSNKGLLANIDANYPIEEVDKIISQCKEALYPEQKSI